MTKKILILSSALVVAETPTPFCDEFMRGAIEVVTKQKRFSCVTRQSIIAQDAAHVACTENLARRKTMRQIIEKMVAADVIVMATPVYFYTMSAQMKTLIDRCCGLYTEMKNKEFYFIVTAAEDDRKLMERTVDTFQGFLDCLENPTIKGVVYGTGVWHVGEIKDKPTLREAYEMGKEIE